MAFLDRLSAAMKAAGFKSRRGLSTAAGLSHGAVQFMFDNGVTNPEPKSVEALARVLKVTPQSLLYGDDGPPLISAGVEYVERYPGRAEAAKILKGVVRQDAIEETFGWGLSASEDPGVEWWAEQMKRVARLKDQRERTPGAAEKERARHVAEGDDLEAQADAHLAAATAPPASNDAPPPPANDAPKKGGRGKK